MANSTRLGSGTNALAQTGLPVLLADLQVVIPPVDPNRGFDAVVIGEPPRAFSGNQYC